LVPDDVVGHSGRDGFEYTVVAAPWITCREFVAASSVRRSRAMDDAIPVSNGQPVAAGPYIQPASHIENGIARVMNSMEAIPPKGRDVVWSRGVLSFMGVSREPVI
jgi:hypothetical protein